MPFPLTNREFLGRYLCFKEPTGDLVLVFEPLPGNTKVDYGANLKVVRGKIMGVFRFKPINDGTQCEVALIQHGDAGGFLPKRVMVAKIPQVLRGVGEMREIFQRDDAIDGAKRSELAATIKCVPPVVPPLPPPPTPNTAPPTLTHRAALASSRTCPTRTSSSPTLAPSLRACPPSRSSSPPTTSSTCPRSSRRGAATSS
jgi:hypothetical protein